MNLQRRLVVAATAGALAAASVRPVWSAESASEKAVDAKVQELRQAMLEPSKKVLDELFDPKLTWGHSDGRVQTGAEYTEALLTKASAFSKIDLSNQTITLIGDDAVVRHIFEADTTSGGKPAHVKIAILQIWQKRANDWKLIVRQAYVARPA